MAKGTPSTWCVSGVSATGRWPPPHRGQSRWGRKRPKNGTKCCTVACGHGPAHPLGAPCRTFAEVETYDGVADQCFIVARLTHDDVLEPQDFGRTVFVNTGDSRGGWHDISPSKRQRSSFACSQSGASVPWLVEDGRGRCDLPNAEDRPRQRLKLDAMSAG
jgi:hypothetical protein